MKKDEQVFHQYVKVIVDVIKRLEKQRRIKEISATHQHTVSTRGHAQLWSGLSVCKVKNKCTKSAMDGNK